MSTSGPIAPLPVLGVRSSAIAGELAFALVSAAVILPLWAVPRPPLGDLPQHVAIVRILHDFHTAPLRFDAFYRVELGSTQHVAWYLVADLLAYLTGVAASVKILLSTTVVAIPYSLRALLRALGRDERLAWLSFGVLWSPLLLFGFVQFLAGIPLMLLGLALAARLRRRPRRSTGLALGAVALVCLFTHLIPFGLLAAGTFLLLATRDVLATARKLAWLIPAFLCGLGWMLSTEAGQAVLGSVALGRVRTGVGQAHEPVFLPSDRALRELHEWVGDVLVGPFDDGCLAAWALIAAAAIVLGTTRSPAPTAVRRLGLLALMAGAAYFLLPESYAWIWPISPRFAVLAILLGICALPFPSGRTGTAVVLALAVLALVQSNAIATAFARFDRDESGAFDRAVARIPQGQRVIGLMFDAGSKHVRFWPFTHYVGWVQAERGGAVAFSFADHPSSPVRWRADAGRPETGPTGFRPGTTDPRELLWADYVIVRGGPGAIERSSCFERIHDDHWSVWKRRDAAPGCASPE